MGNVSFDILGRDKASAAFDKVGKSVDKVDRKFGFLSARSKGLSAGMTAGFGKVAAGLGAIATVSAFKGFIDEAREAGKVTRLTEQVIKTTGGAAKISADGVGKLAERLSEKAGIDDEVIQTGANLLLTFKNVRNEVGKGANVFDRATAAAVDLSAAGFGSVDGASKMLGKALNDPLKGISALGRAGVTFTDQQKKQIKVLVESGKTLEAQKIILKEVESQVGGAAAAAADPMQKLGVVVGNLKERLGTALLPAVNAVANFLADKLPLALDKSAKFFRQHLQPPLDRLVGFVKTTGIPVLRGLGEVFQQKIVPRLKEFAGFVQDTVLPLIGTIISTFSGLGSKIVSAIGEVDLSGIGADIRAGAKAWAGGIIGGLQAGLTTGNWAPLGRAIGNGVVTSLRSGAGIIDKLGAAIEGLIDRVNWGALGTKVSNAIRDLFRSVDWGKIGEALGDAVIAIVRRTSTLGEKLATAFREVIGKIDWNRIGRDSTAAIAGIVSGIRWGTVAKVFFKAIVGSLKINVQVKNAVIDSASDLVIGVVSELLVQMERFRSWLARKAKEVGGALVSGLKSGISSAVKGIGGWLKRVLVDPAVGSVKAWFGVRSPSTVFMAIGKNLVYGLMNGILAIARGIGSWLSRNLVRPITNAFAKARVWLVNGGKNVIIGLINGMVGYLRAVGGIGRWLYTNVVTPAVSLFAKAGSWLVGGGRSVITGLFSGMVAYLRAVSGAGVWVYRNVVTPIVNVFSKAGTWLVNAGRNVLQGFWSGLQEKWSAVTKWVSGIATWIKNNKGPVSLDARLLIPAGRAIMDGFLKGLKSGAGPAWNFVKSVGGKTRDLLANEQMLNVPPGVLNNVGGNYGIVRRIAAQRGWDSGPQWAALYKLVQGESGFRNTAQNPTSTAYGLFQFLNSTWATVGARKTSDPALQTVAGLKYIANSYGDPVNAYSKWLNRSPHWYADGGVIAERVLGVGLRSGRPYHIGERGPEMVTPMNRMPQRPGGAAVVGVLEVIHKTPDGRELHRELLRLRRTTRQSLGLG